MFLPGALPHAESVEQSARGGGGGIGAMWEPLAGGPVKLGRMHESTGRHFFFCSVKKDDVDIEGAESRESSIYRIAKQQRQEYEEYDYETGYEVDIAEPRSSSYGAPQETYGAPQETYGSPHEEPYGSYDSGHKVM